MTNITIVFPCRFKQGLDSLSALIKSTILARKAKK